MSIQDITDEADVGLGTFYNHFKSKIEVVKAIADEYFENYTEVLESLLTDLDDPAEVISVSYRYTLTLALDAQIFPILLHLPAIYLRQKIALRASADVDAGVQQRRFDVDNSEVLMTSITGMLLGVMESYAQGSLSQSNAEHTAVYFLRLLGIDENEAKALVSMPMPELPPLG